MPAIHLFANYAHVKCRFVVNLLLLYDMIRDAFYCAMLCMRGTSHGPVSDCLSTTVCLSQLGVLLKRLNVRSHKQHHTIAHNSCRLLVARSPKISAKFDRGHPLRRRQMQVGWVKIGNFRQITAYISKTVKDRHIISIKVE